MFDNITGIILTGGNSSRMGKDKALLPLPDNEGVTFVEQLTTMLTPLCSEVLLVARDDVQAANYAHLIGARTLTDRVPGHGPLMGLCSGLSAMHNLHALVVAVDMPFVQPALLSFLLSQPLTSSLLVPVVNTIPQVLLAIYPRAVLPFIERRLQEGRRDLRSLLEVAPVRYIDETQLRLVDPELRSFINVNTPGELSLYAHKQ